MPRAKLRRCFKAPAAFARTSAFALPGLLRCRVRIRLRLLGVKFCQSVHNCFYGLVTRRLRSNCHAPRRRTKKMPAMTVLTILSLPNASILRRYFGLVLVNRCLGSTRKKLDQCHAVPLEFAISLRLAYGFFTFLRRPQFESEQN